MKTTTLETTHIRRGNFLLLLPNDKEKAKQVADALWAMENNKNSYPENTDKYLQH